MDYTKIGNINEYVSQSINPMKTPDTIFEMYSVPVYDTGHPEYLRGDEIASSKIVVQKDDILLCKINPRINRVWVVNDESDKQNIASSEWIVIRNKVYNPEFLAWYFRTQNFQKLMTSEVTGIGGSLTRAQPKRVAEYPVPILEREKQDKIVSTLNKVKYIIDARRKELQELDNLIKSRFVEMFGSQKDNPYGFETGELSDVADIYLGLTHTPTYVESGKPFLSVKDISTGEIKFSSCHYITEAEFASLPNGARPKEGDILFCRVGTIGKPVIIPKGTPEFGTFVSVGYLRKKSNVINEYLKSWMENDYFMQQVYNNVAGASQINLNTGWLKKFSILIPPLSLQNEFVTFVNQVDKLKFEVQKSLEEMQTLMDSLMQQYFG